MDIEHAPAERLPFEDGAFDATLAQLVVHFMSDPAAGISEMRRVTRRGGIVAACVWDFGGGRAPLASFWAAARRLDPGVEDESRRAGAQEGVSPASSSAPGCVTSRRRWFPSPSSTRASRTGGVRTRSASVRPARSSPADRDDQLAELRERCLALLPEAPFVLTSCAWASRGVV